MALLSARQILISAIVAFVWNVSVSPASACDCAGRPTCATLWDADLVFVGTVNRIVTTAPATEEATFTIEEWLRGEPVEKEMTIVSAGIGFSCEYDFAPAGRYLVFARKAPNGSWKAALCGGTTPIESKQGRADLAEIKAALNSRQPGTVSGEVAFDEDPAERIMPGAPIARTAVRLRSESTTLTTQTDERGEFRFSQVPPGRYSLSATLPPNAVDVPPLPVTVGANACVQRYVFPDRRE